jgi:hypothetical protein
MTMTRLRPAYTPEQLKDVYPVPHNHWMFGRGHVERVDAMIKLGSTMTNIHSIADLSCGDGHVARAIAESPEPSITGQSHPRGHVALYLGDIAPGYEFHGPIEETIEKIPIVDMFTCGETLEHLDDPETVLRQIRTKTLLLVVSTPTDNWGDTNAEHYWSWSEEDVEQLMTDVGFKVVSKDVVDSRTWGEPYKYGIWLCT